MSWYCQRQCDKRGATGWPAATARDVLSPLQERFPTEPGRPASLLSAEELAVDKVLAVFGRAEARDFADLMAVEPRYGLDRLCQLAAEKDRGFLPSVFAEMLGQFARLRREEFELDDARYEQLRSTVERWREHAIELAQHENP